MFKKCSSLYLSVCVSILQCNCKLFFAGLVNYSLVCVSIVLGQHRGCCGICCDHQAQTTCCLPIPPSSAWTTRAAMGNNTDVVHYIKCEDPKTPVRKRCHRCYKKYRSNNSALNRQKKNDLINKKQEVWQIKRDPFIQIYFVIYVRALTYFFSHLFTYLFIYLSIDLFMYLFIHSFINWFIYISIYLFTYLFIY